MTTRTALAKKIFEQSASISKNIPILRNEQTKIAVRIAVANRTLQRLHKLLDTYDEESDIEQLEFAVAHHEAVLNDLTSFAIYLESELDKIIAGHTTATALPPSEAALAFMTYLAEDTKRSIANLNSTRNEYKEVFARLKELSSFWL